MKIKIYSQDGTLKLTASPGSGGQCVKQLQGDSELTLSFDYFEYVALDVNDYMDFCGDRYWLLEQYRPKEVSTVQWKYDVHLYGIESLIKRYLVIEHTDGDANPVFTLTAPASQHMRMIVECLNNATGTTDWHVGTVETTGNITIDYTGKYCDEGLRELAEAANTEYWFDGRTVNLCKCERGTALQLGYDDGLISLERDVADNAKFYTRLYPVGSSRNINPETYGHTRLQLPDGQKYVDLDVAKYGVIDHYEQEAFSGIYPRYTGTVSGVRVEDRTDEDGTEFKVFFFSDASLPFDPNSYLLPNEKMRVSFQTGDLQGLGDTDDHYFEADYNSTTGEFEIINIWTEGEQLPRPGLSPAVGDQYIPWNISMPASYITLAEQEFAAAVNTYNQEHFKDISVYRGTTDHVWIEADPAQDKPEVDVFIGRRVRLVSSQYFPGTGYRDSRIVKITRRLDLPSQMELEISDAVSTGTLTKISDDIRGVWEFAKGLEVDGDDRWLSKRRNDTAQGFIRFIRGLQVGERFVNGLLGEGGVFRKEADGTTYLETDKLYVRMKAYFDSVDVRDYIHSAGNRVASQAKGFTCSRVEWLDANGNILEQTQENLSSVAIFRCYWRVDDGDKKTDNQFRIGDLAFCQDTEVTNDSLTTHGFHRLVVGRNPGTETTAEGEAWIDLSNAHESNGNPKLVTITWSGQGGTQQSMSALSFRNGSDAPVKEDDIVQLGSVNDPGRQGAIIEFVSGADAPSYQIFQGIGADASNPYSLTGKNYLSLGYATGPSGTHGSGHAYIEVFGDVFIGAQPNPQTGESPTYIRYDQDTQQLDIKANVTFTSPTTHQDTTIEDFAGAVTNSIEDLQEQIDGEIDTWFYEGTPTLNNAPANEWTTATEKERHLGDLYYDIGTGATGGFAYRFIKDENNVYQWQYIEDTAITEALAKAAEAYDLADHKRRVFYTTPTPPYDNGDLWVNAVWPASGASQGSTYNDDILRCVTSRATGNFDIGDWTLASNYTDDSALIDFVNNTYAQDLENLETQIDGKAETWYQDSDPSTVWTDTDTKVAHVGDIWYDTSANGGKKTYIWRDRGEGQSNRFYWAEQAVPDDVFDKIDGKAAIYVAWNAWMVDGVSQLNAKDLFIPSSDTTQGGVAYKANKVYRCINASTPTFQEIRYTDDTTVDYIINSYGNILGISSPTAQNVGEALGFLRQVLGGSTSVDGGLVLTNLIAMKDAASTPNIWGGISGMYKTAETGTTWKGYGIAAWYGGAMVDKECLNATHISQGWNTHRWARSLFRFDGSGYVADGNISWDKNGTPTIKGYVIDTETLKIGGNTVNLSDYVTLATDQTITGTKTFQNRIKIGDIYIGYDSTNDAIEVYKLSGSTHVAADFYATGGVSALGITSGGGGGGASLNQPLSGINSAGLSAPSSAGLGLVFNGSAWVYTNAASMSVYGLTVSSTLQAYNAIFGSTVSGAAFSATGGGFSVSGKDNTYVLLAGGGTKLLSEIGGGGGAVNSITLGQGGTNYTPDANGIVTLPPYPSGTVTGVSYNGGNPITPTSGVVSLGGLCVTVKVGSTDYGVSSSGVISLPAYPSTSGLVSSVVIGSSGTPISPVSGVVTLPAYPSKTSQLTNDSGFITGYTDTKNTAGTTNNVNTKLFLAGATSQGANPQTYSNSSCYIGTDNCLYSGGTKVATGTIPSKTSQLTNDSGFITGYTDTKNTAGSTNKVNTKMYFVAAESQAANPTTYSNSSCYIGTDNCLYSGGTKVLTSHQSLAGYATQTWVQQQGYTIVNSSSVITIGGLNIVTGSGVTGGANIAGKVGIGGNANSSYYLLVYGTTRLNNMELGEETTISTVTCAMIRTRSSRGIYVKTGTAPNYVDGSWSNASDIRLKDIVSNIGGSVDDIANAPIFNFRWKNGDGQVMVGTKAQYWQGILPNTVTEGPEGYLYMDYSAAAIAAAVITARKVQNHEGRLQILERENEALRREIQILKSA